VCEREREHPRSRTSFYWKRSTLVTFFFFFFTLVTGPRRSLSLKLSDTRVYEPQIRARLGNTTHFCEVVVLKLRAVPNWYSSRFKKSLSGPSWRTSDVRRCCCSSRWLRGCSPTSFYWKRSTLVTYKTPSFWAYPSES